jgi:hypothetical protein
MAKVKITGHASGSGVITVTAPNTSTDRVITLPDSTSTLATTAEAFNPDAAQVFNESGADVDFRVEGSNEANALFVQGSDGNVGIGTNTPTGFEIRDKVIRISKQSSVTAYRIMGNDKGNDLAIQSSDTADGTAYTSRLNIMNDGRGLSQFTAKAWVNFNGTGTVAIRDSHNVSSITDNDVGRYTINFSNNMANTSYAPTGAMNADQFVWLTSLAVGSYKIRMYNAGYADRSEVFSIVFGD